MLWFGCFAFMPVHCFCSFVVMQAHGRRCERAAESATNQGNLGPFSVSVHNVSRFDCFAFDASLNSFVRFANARSVFDTYNTRSHAKTKQESTTMTPLERLIYEMLKQEQAGDATLSTASSVLPVSVHSGSFSCFILFLTIISLRMLVAGVIELVFRLSLREALCGFCLCSCAWPIAMLCLCSTTRKRPR